MVAVDPPASSRRNADACGIVAAGVDEAGAGYVHRGRDRVGACRPSAGRRAPSRSTGGFEADALVAEVNQGGEMVEAVMRQVDPAVPVTRVHATRGKYLRAEPVSALYEQGRVHHVGAFPELEDEMCDFGSAASRPAARPTASTRSSGRSPR